MHEYDLKVLEKKSFFSDKLYYENWALKKEEILLESFSPVLGEQVKIKLHFGIFFREEDIGSLVYFDHDFLSFDFDCEFEYAKLPTFKDMLKQVDSVDKDFAFEIERFMEEVPPEQKTYFYLEVLDQYDNVKPFHCSLAFKDYTEEALYASIDETGAFVDYLLSGKLFSNLSYLVSGHMLAKAYSLYKFLCSSYIHCRDFKEKFDIEELLNDIQAYEYLLSDLKNESSTMHKWFSELLVSYISYLEESKLIVQCKNKKCNKLVGYYHSKKYCSKSCARQIYDSTYYYKSKDNQQTEGYGIL